MRALKRWLRSEYAEYRIHPRRKQLERELSAHFGHVVTLVRSGSAGRDSIYYLLRDGTRFAVMRLANPCKRRAPLPPDLPFVWLEDAARLDREWRAYTVGSAAGLTPRPLWRSHDAIVCEYLPLQPLFERFMRDGTGFWSFVLRGTRAISDLHKTGLTHMDASLANILADASLQNIAFIDFEYGPAAFITAAQQRAYDYLRLMESCIKFVGPDEKRASQGWFDLLETVVDAETRSADLSVLTPALGRVMNDEYLRPGLERIFGSLVPVAGRQPGR